LGPHTTQSLRNTLSGKSLPRSPIFTLTFYRLRLSRHNMRKLRDGRPRWTLRQALTLPTTAAELRIVPTAMMASRGRAAMVVATAATAARMEAATAAMEAGTEAAMEAASAASTAGDPAARSAVSGLTRPSTAATTASPPTTSLLSSVVKILPRHTPTTTTLGSWIHERPTTWCVCGISLSFLLC
jgi:hypothetical protein